MKILLTRLFITNWKTTFCGVAMLGCGAAFWLGKMTATELLSFVTLLGGASHILSKDGVREDTPVAREDVPMPDSATPNEPAGPNIP